ncbi:MAG: type II toxin-antitoxin system VapC family toxin [Acidobacteria bacterium]|nr:type II toxin-antitoxin system VapC family toxin [Acidobacteriota bacterium]
MSATPAERAFWDTSAVVPLCCRQDDSQVARRLLRRYARAVVWWGASVEAVSAFNRLAREGKLTTKGVKQATARLEVLRRAWSEVLPTDRVRQLAEGLPEQYGLRALDSFQLAAALVWCRERPRRRIFVCLDERLSEAAAKAGFDVAP